MKTLSNLHIPDSACLSKVLRYLDEEISHLTEVLKDDPVMTDGGTDITGSVKSKKSAYTNIKFFIEREC